MGSGASAATGDTPGADLRLPGAGLRFSLHQLRALNSYVDTLHEEDQKGRLSTEMECAVENLVQRIVDGAGQRDPRFRCCHLIALHRGKRKKCPKVHNSVPYARYKVMVMAHLLKRWTLKLAVRAATETSDRDKRPRQETAIVT